MTPAPIVITHNKKTLQTQQKPQQTIFIKTHYRTAYHSLKEKSFTITEPTCPTTKTPINLSKPSFKHKKA